MSTDLTISDKIDNLYSSFEKNESEIAELQSANQKRSHAKDRLQHKKQAIASQLVQREGEFQTLKVTIANLREQQNTFEELVSKEKDRQHTVYLALLEVEEQVAHLEEERLVLTHTETTQLRERAAEQFQKRESYAPLLMEELAKIAGRQ